MAQRRLGVWDLFGSATRVAQPTADQALERALDLLNKIRDALDTEETGDKLVTVAGEQHCALMHAQRAIELEIKVHHRSVKYGALFININRALGKYKDEACPKCGATENDDCKYPEQPGCPFGD